jgi:hypothetical protein
MAKKDWREAKAFLKRYFAEHGTTERSEEVQRRWSASSVCAADPKTPCAELRIAAVWFI